MEAIGEQASALYSCEWESSFKVRAFFFLSLDMVLSLGAIATLD